MICQRGASPMADQNSILKLLARADLTNYASPIDELVRLSHAPRKSVLQALGNLMQNKLAERAGGPGLPAHYRITDKGNGFVRAGKRITSGPKGNLTGVPKARSGNGRALIWNALRMKRCATLPELAELCRTKKHSDPKKVSENARKYLNALRRAGIVVVMARREEGHAPSSNGYLRFRLLRDLGPKAPVPCRLFVFDVNSSERIAYREGVHA